MNKENTEGMGKINLLDCTLRDGGYINDWNFGQQAIEDIIYKLAQTGIEMIEIGFIKGDTYNPNKSLFPDTDSFAKVIRQKKKDVTYVGMIDMNQIIPLERIVERKDDSIDGIRVIFKKNKMNEAFSVCQHIKRMGYKLFVHFVNTDLYSDKEFIEAIEKYNKLRPTGMAIVDTFGTIKRKQFNRLVAIADNNMKKDIMLCYHAHNNLQQAFGNAEALVEMNLSRDIIVDACVFGMGRGAGNLNLELFAEYMNENYGTEYNITPMLEIMDEYLTEFYKNKFWGYSLPLYLSARAGCHPNYAIYLAEKNTLTEKAFSELLFGIADFDKINFTKDKAEFYYETYMEHYVDDTICMKELSEIFCEKEVLLLAPGKTIKEYYSSILDFVKKANLLTISINFYDSNIHPDFIFASNLRRFRMLSEHGASKIIATSNIKESSRTDYVINISSLTISEKTIHDNTGVMALNLLNKLGVKKVYVAGMDGYNSPYGGNYYDEKYEINRHNNFENMNNLMIDAIGGFRKHMNIEFITPSKYND